MADFEAMTHAWVTRAIRAEMVKSGITFGDLAQRINALGGNENERNLRNKIARGTFSAALFAQCLAAMGSRNLEIDLLDRFYALPRGETQVTRQFGSAEKIEEVVRAVWASLQSDPPPANRSLGIGMEAVRGEVARTDIRPWLKSEMPLEELVRDIRDRVVAGGA